jgi:hypothetical protein
MAGNVLGIQWIGSFQDARNYAASENPLEEVWAQVARQGTDSFLERVKPDNASLPWQDHLRFAKVRFQQAVQFWRAARASPLLTAPLPLYYAFLSLMRADMALGPEVMPRSGHGLKFVKGADLLSCVARLNEGTFTHWLRARGGIDWSEGDQISLKDALACVVELSGDLQGIGPWGHVQFIAVSGIQRGDLSLAFPEYPRDFATNWTPDFPKLAPVCRLAAAPVVNTLIAERAASGETYDSIAKFLDSHLLNHLVLTGMDSRVAWWALRATEIPLQLDRIGYYHVAAYILGSVVRYEPELILNVSSADSGLGWLLQRFVDRAARFYPQLMMAKARGGQIYF